MKHKMIWLFAGFLAISLLGYHVNISSAASVPTITIISVDPDKSVTIQMGNLPASQTFKVTMGMNGTKGVGGIEVGSVDTGNGIVDQQTYEIPTELVGQAIIAIRIESAQGFFAYNFFTNAPNSSGTPAPTTTPSTTTTTVPTPGIPLISISNVIPGQQVTIAASNFPPNQTFVVTMGKMGTKGVGGIEVDKTDSQSGGSFEATYSIPPDLASLSQIAIRLQSSQGYFSYNWFWNVSQSTPAPTQTPSTPSGGTTSTPSAFVIPTFSITTVVQDNLVIINTANFPANQTFTVTMGKYGTLGVGGTEVGTTQSGPGGSFQATYNIPADLKGMDRIAIRLQSSQGYFSYNWFWNVTFPEKPTG